MNEINLKLWKTLMYVAVTCSAIQIGLFVTNILINGHFNWVIFTQVIGWSLWASFCFYKLYFLKNPKTKI